MIDMELANMRLRYKIKKPKKSKKKKSKKKKNKKAKKVPGMKQNKNRDPRDMLAEVTHPCMLTCLIKLFFQLIDCGMVKYLEKAKMTDLTGAPNYLRIT